MSQVSPQGGSSAEFVPKARIAHEGPARSAMLADRGAVLVTGMDAKRLLQGIITNDLDVLEAGELAMLAGLLSPQGKILFEFLVSRRADGFVLEVAREQSAALAKRLALYKLRASVDIADAGDSLVVFAAWGGAPVPANSNAYLDPREPALGMRGTMAAGGLAVGMTWSASAADYHAHRIALGIPEGGKDYDFGDAFPHEANFDLDHGVSFEKGCYVGQEVVARMQHKTVVRKRVVRVSAARELPPGRPDVKAGEIVIGRLGSVAGTRGLAMLRLDRVLEFQVNGIPVHADGITLSVDAHALESYRRSATAQGAKPA